MKQLYRYLFLFCAVAGYAGAKMSSAGPFNYVITLDSGGVVSAEHGVESRGGVVHAHKGVIEVMSYNVGRALQQDNIVICSVPVFRNLLTVVGDPVSPDRIAWWRRYVLSTDEAEKNLRDNIAALVPERQIEIKFVREELLPHVQKEYDLYLAKTEDLMVCIPKGMAPKQVGVLPTKLEPFALGSDYGVAERALSKHETVTLSAVNLVGLFDAANKVPKNIILNGHGNYDVGHFGKALKSDRPPLFAGLDPDAYRLFVQKLTEIWCQSLFVDSCFTGAEAVAQMHAPTVQRASKLYFDLREIKFPVIMGATVANPTQVWAFFVDTRFARRDYEAYFNAIDRFVVKISNRHFDQAQGPLIEACKALQGGLTKDNTPSVRLPGKNSAFRAVNTTADSVKVLTVEEQKTWLKNRPLEPLILPNVEDGILLCYPAIVTIPIVIPRFDEKLREKFAGHGEALISPQLLSMSHGVFTHTFKKIDAHDLGFVDVLRALLGTISPTPQAFVVDELVCLDKTPALQSEDASQKQLFRGLVIKVEPATVKSPDGKDVHIIRITGVRKDAETGKYQEAVAPDKFKKIDEGRWYVVLGISGIRVGDVYPAFRLVQTVWKDIDAVRYKKVADEIISSTLPDNETIFQASGGQEFVKLVESSAKAIVAKTVA